VKWSSSSHSRNARASASSSASTGGGLAAELGEDVAGALPHRLPVLDGDADVPEDAAEVRAELFVGCRVGQPVELEVDQ
jgi:hypothetical protein